MERRQPQKMGKRRVKSEGGNGIMGEMGEILALFGVLTRRFDPTIERGLEKFVVRSK